MKESTVVSRNQLISNILHIGHGSLNIFKDIALKGVESEPELFGHLIAWNYKRGQVRDSKVALPVLALQGPLDDDELNENAVAHLCLLDPRNLIKAIQFYASLIQPRKWPWPQPETTSDAWLKSGIRQYLKVREANRGWWIRTALQHRKSLKTLYAMNHIKPNPYAQKILFERNYPANSVFAKLGQLKNMSQEEAAGTILNHNIPFLVAMGAVGKMKGKPDLIMALLQNMSRAELITNTKIFEKLGVFSSSMLNAAYEKAMEKTKGDKKVSSLKTTKAKQAVKGKKAKAKLEQIEEEGTRTLGGIEGDWLVLGDRSSSMRESMETAKSVASLLAHQVKGKVYLIFFNTAPTFFDVTGKSYSEISEQTRRVTSGGMTSIGCGLDFIAQLGIIVNGIAICSDGGENTQPLFVRMYKRYADQLGIEPPVYLFHVPGDPNGLSKDCVNNQVLLETFELGRQVDYYSLPNIVQTLKASRYSLVEEIMETPLLTFKNVFGEGSI